MGANQLLKDYQGYVPLHYSCLYDNITITRLLINNENGKRGLLISNNLDQKPIELCNTNFMKQRVENAMRKLKIFVKPRVSILNR